MKPDLSVAVGEEVVARDTLTANIDAATKGDKNERIYLRADKAVSYGDLMEVMNLSAQRRLSQDRAGRPRRPQLSTMNAFALHDVPDQAVVRRWGASAVAILAAHAALVVCF